MSTEGFQHFPLAAGFHRISGGLHCCQSIAAHIQDKIMQVMDKKYMKTLWALPGFSSRINKIATPSFGTENAKIPGIKAMLFHLMAFDSWCGSR